MNWIGTARFIYNKALEYTKKEGIRPNAISLTPLFITQKSREGIENTNIPSWTFETPKDIRKGSLRDLEKAFKSAISNLRNGNIDRFNLGYRKKKNQSSLEIPSTALKYKDGKISIYPKYLDSIKISKRQKKKENIVINETCRLQYYRNQWFLIVPTKKTTKERNPPTKECCSLDPGVRTFQTIYTLDEVIKIQQNRTLLEKLRKKIDTFQSLRDQKLIKRSSYTRRINRIYRKIENITTELHYKTIGYLKEYKCILLPSFDNQEMVSNNRFLSRKTKRELLGLNHYKFKCRLQNSLELDRYSNVNIVNESYTSKTCSNCGDLNKPGVDIYKCKKCELVIDRDINGARNILIKHLKQI